ncbi:MAG: hypothetical protein LBV60_11900 [Streptomyces sp.]|jgi:hypothetical protein|nr:hypothetical protein [Streptomyces sp.]
MRDTTEEQWGDTERRLRLLLLEAVPGLTAPADRMTQVRRRVRLRRRRRAAATGVVAAVAVATFIGGSDGLLSSSPDRKQTEPAVSPSRGSVVSLMDRSRPLRISLPDGWQALSVEDGRGAALAFAATQPLQTPARAACDTTQDDALSRCRPLPKLKAGRVIMAFHYGDKGVGWTAPEAPLRVGAVHNPAEGCAAVGADQEISGWGRADPGSHGRAFDVRVTVCLNGPSERTVATVRDVLRETFVPAEK